MLADSNFYVLTHYKLPATEKEKRTQYLEDTIKQLRQYKPKQQSKIKALPLIITKYESLLDKLQEEITGDEICIMK